MRGATDLVRVTREWSMQWWDRAEHMVWNPPGSLAAGMERAPGPPRAQHRVDRLRVARAATKTGGTKASGPCAP